MLPAVLIQSDDGGRVLDHPSGRPRRGRVHGDAEGNHILMNELGRAIVRIRNCIQLLAGPSTGVEEIQKHILLLDSGHGQRQIQVVFPFDIVQHVDLQRSRCCIIMNRRAYARNKDTGEHLVPSYSFNSKYEGLSHFASYVTRMDMHRH